jgi:hypothetical protein
MPIAQIVEMPGSRFERDVLAPLGFGGNSGIEFAVHNVFSRSL